MATQQNESDLSNRALFWLTVGFNLLMFYFFHFYQSVDLNGGVIDASSDQPVATVTFEVVNDSFRPLHLREGKLLWTNRYGNECWKMVSVVPPDSGRVEPGQPAHFLLDGLDESQIDYLESKDGMYRLEVWDHQGLVRTCDVQMKVSDLRDCQRRAEHQLAVVQGADNPSPGEEEATVVTVSAEVPVESGEAAQQQPQTHALGHSARTVSQQPAQQRSSCCGGRSRR